MPCKFVSVGFFLAFISISIQYAINHVSMGFGRKFHIFIKTDCWKVGLKCTPVPARLESGSTERDASEMVVSSYAKGDKQHRGGDHRAERGERERGEQRGEGRMRIELLLGGDDYNCNNIFTLSKELYRLN